MTAAPDPRLYVAETVYTAMSDPDDPSWAEMDEEDRTDILCLTEEYIAAHVAYLTSQGFRLVPPGATPIPKTEEEAMGMLQAAKAFFDAQKRKGALMTGAVKPNLILPPGMKH